MSDEIRTQGVQQNEGQELTEEKAKEPGLTPGDYEKLVGELRQENAKRRVENRQLREKLESAERAFAELQARLSEMELENAALKEALNAVSVERIAMEEIARRGVGKHADILLPAIRERFGDTANVAREQIANALAKILDEHPELLGVPGTPRGSQGVAQERTVTKLKLTF